MYKKYKSSEKMGTGSSVGSPHPASGREDARGRSGRSPQATSTSRPVVTSQDSQAAKDVMISYSHADKEMMAKVKDVLESNGISVWVDVVGLNAGVDFLSKIGQAIIDAKLFIQLLSQNCVKSKYCQDELALAYVSNTAIFPITLTRPRELYPHMDTGMKLQLAGYQWVEIWEEGMFDAKMAELIPMLKEALEEKDKDTETEKKDVSKEKKTKQGRPKLQRQQTRQNLNRKKAKNERVKSSDEVLNLMPEEYWKKFYMGDSVVWNKFVDNFMSLYKTPLEQTFSSNDQTWLVSILRREMEVDDDGMLSKTSFIEFCTVDGEEFPLWKRVEEQARESYAMKEVFDMDSSVRVEAIENLGRFRSLAVIDALRDLLTDTDANVRAVAAVSLARTEANDSQTVKHLLKILNDKDRLVREAGCLALGHLQAQSAVKKLLHMWRNDVISHVREAASVTLQQIGGSEVDKAMHVTSVLAEEIRQLTAE
ncbi:LOW QUALITY PROTEIN: uncharacterized protein LOC124266076 [Haliotis rubra]|uniref:LOW QUALITY PROTEIN: uncharacterized protein LOC124266076 n=1 Tax=Haliotis rubra TaxID=36100 RepID=UPI001EE54C13|nr:LOW QUALITY PROTEIN: uncharacterized protein LOC124266076 [Haliotis rubra]